MNRREFLSRFGAALGAIPLVGALLDDDRPADRVRIYGTDAAGEHVEETVRLDAWPGEARMRAADEIRPGDLVTAEPEGTVRPVDVAHQDRLTAQVAERLDREIVGTVVDVPAEDPGYATIRLE